MSQMTEHPTYDDLVGALQDTQSPLEAPEVHGIICGLICASNGNLEANWEKLVVGPTENPESLAFLGHLYAETYREMTEFSFEFTLLLPDDDADINLRAESLGLFCQGFLTGLRQVEGDVEKRMSSEVLDALKDLIEISQVKYDNITSTEEDETAYFELLEYVRLVVLMIFHELRTGGDQAAPSADLLH